MKNIVVCVLFAVVSCFGIYIESAEGIIGVGVSIEGMFAIGVPPNPPVYPDVRPLIGDHRAVTPCGAAVSFYIDGKIYTQSDLVVMMYPDSAASLGDFMLSDPIIDTVARAINVDYYIIADPFGNDSIFITQTLTPYENADTATVRLRWSVVNESGISHEIGLLLFFDVVDGIIVDSIHLPGVAFAPSLIMPDPPSIPTMPEFWFTEVSTDLPLRNDLTSPPNITPDKVALADCRELLGLLWELGSIGIGAEDLAGAIWWFPSTVPSGDSVVFLTSMGTLVDTASAITEARTPGDFAISVYPNPFNSTCQIGIESGELGVESVEIYDVSGRMVAEIPANNAVGANLVFAHDTGDHEYRPYESVVWTPAPSLGSGVYLVRATMQGNKGLKPLVQTKRVVYLK